MSVEVETPEIKGFTTEDVAAAIDRMSDNIALVIETLHKISEAATLTAAQIEAFCALLRLGEINVDEYDAALGELDGREREE